MKLGKGLAIGLLLLAVFGARLYFNATAKSYSDSESYYVLRQVDSIKATGLPAIQDQLSFGGKQVSMIPGYYYLMAGLSYLGEWFAFKIFPALISALLALAAYLVASEFTKEWPLALIAGYFAGFVPAFFRMGTNTLGKSPMTLTLFFFCAFFLIRLENQKPAFRGLLACSIALTLISPLALLLVAIVWVYMGLISLQELKIQGKSFEFMLFFTFLTLLLNLLAFARSGLESGMLGLLNAYPQSLFNAPGLDWVLLISGVNLFVLVLGVLGAYYAVSLDANKRAASLLLSLSIGIVLLGALRLIGLESVLSYIGVVLSITSVNALSQIMDYAKKLRVMRGVLIAAFIAIVILPVFAVGIYEGFSKPSASIEDTEALSWLANVATGDEATIAPAEYGHLITYFAMTENVADSNFINSRDFGQRQEDIQRAYAVPFETEAIALFDKYNVKYILLNPQIMAKYNISGISYIGDENCFENIYNQSVKIFEVKCNLR